VSEEYGFLWEDPGARYVLIQLRENSANAVIWDKELHGIMLIEDDEEYQAVVSLMKQHGVPVMTTMPKQL
jgi:hypothetical protein